MIETYHDIASEADLALGQSRAHLINGWPILLCRSEAGLFAIINRCTHAASPLEGGRIRRNTISCPLHSARFDIASGQCVGAAYRPLKTFAVRIEKGRVAVAVPNELPGDDHRPLLTG